CRGGHSRSATFSGRWKRARRIRDGPGLFNKNKRPPEACPGAANGCPSFGQLEIIRGAYISAVISHAEPVEDFGIDPVLDIMHRTIGKDRVHTGRMRRPHPTEMLPGISGNI